MVNLLVVLLLIQAPPAGGGDWQHTFDEPVIAISAEHDGDCFAALTERALAVFTYEGRRLWSRDLTTLGSSFRAGGVALAPTCHWAAVMGTSSYRYVWVLEKGGGGRYAAFRGETPTAVAISPQGDRIAVATGASRLHLLRPGLGTRSMLERHAVKTTELLPRTLLFSRDGRRLMTTWGYGAGSFDEEGRAIWEESGGVCSQSLPADASWSLAVCMPPHGPGIDWVEARDASGVSLWSRPFADVRDALVSGDGTAAWVMAQPQGSGEDAPQRLMVFTREGKVATDLEVDMHGIVAVARDGTKALLSREPWDLAWYSASGEKLAAETLAEEMSEIDARRGLTRIVGIRDRRLLVLVRTPDGIR